MRLRADPYSIGSEHNYVMVVSSDKFPDLDPDTAVMDAITGRWVSPEPTT